MREGKDQTQGATCSDRAPGGSLEWPEATNGKSLGLGRKRVLQRHQNKPHLFDDFARTSPAAALFTLPSAEANVSIWTDDLGPWPENRGVPDHFPLEVVLWPWH